MSPENGRRSPNIQHSLLRYCLLGLILPVFLFGLFLVFQLNRYRQNVSLESMRQNVESCAAQLDNSLYLTSYTASYLITDSSFIDNILEVTAHKTESAAYKARENIVRSMRSVANTTLISYDAAIDVILPDGSVIGTEAFSSLTEEDAGQLFSQKAFETKYVLWYDPLQEEANSDLTSYWKIYYHGRIIGLLRIRLPGSAFWKSVAGPPLLDQELSITGKDVLIARKSGSFAPSEKTVSFSKELSLGDMTLHVNAARSAIFNGFPASFIGLGILFMVLIAFLFLVVSHITRRISQPIYRLEDQMKQLQNGDTSPKPVIKSYQETEMLSEDLNRVAMQIDTLVASAAKEAAQREQLHLESLMSQIRPHFLYNTLNSIRWMAMINQNPAIADMLSRLGSYLRYSFDQESDTVTVEAELVFLKDYFALQQMRFGNGIEFDASIPEKMMKERIPRFCLQPFMENSFSHGFEKQSEGHMQLTASMDEKNLYFCFSDDGKGADSDIMQSILNGTVRSERSSGIELVNVHRRLQLLFGEEYGIQITTSPGNGFHVRAAMKRRKES